MTKKMGLLLGGIGVVLLVTGLASYELGRSQGESVWFQEWEKGRAELSQAHHERCQATNALAEMTSERDQWRKIYDDTCELQRQSNLAFDGFVDRIEAAIMKPSTAPVVPAPMARKDGAADRRSS